MPRIPREQQQVRCPFCGRMQPDLGCHRTCPSCGSSPLPSYAYPKGHSFYPHQRGESQLQRVQRLVAERRAKRGL